MKISDEQLKEFIELYERKHNEVLDRSTAYEFALKLLQLMSIVYFCKPLPGTKDDEGMVI